MKHLRISTIMLAFLLIVPAIVQGNQEWIDTYVEVGQGKMHVWICGEGLPLLLLHGNTASGRWFTRLDVPDGYMAIAPDLPGFGESYRSGRYDIGLYAESIIELMDAMEIGSAIILGHSLGGAIAVELVYSHQDRFTALIMANTIPFSNARLTEEYLNRAAKYANDDVLLRSALQAIAPTLTDEDMIEMMFEEARKMDPLGFTENPIALTRLNQSGKLAGFGKPVLFLASEQDLTIPSSYMRYYASVTPLARYEELKGIGHAPMLEDPVAFTKAVFGFTHEAVK